MCQAAKLTLIVFARDKSLRLNLLYKNNEKTREGYNPMFLVDATHCFTANYKELDEERQLRAASP